MSLLKTIVLLDIMEIISSNDECPLHFDTLHGSSQDAASDAHIASKWTLLINICAINGLQKQQNSMELMI